MTLMKRKREVSRVQVLRVFVARLICCFESSGAGEAVGSTAVSSEALERLKMPILILIYVSINRLGKKSWKTD